MSHMATTESSSTCLCCDRSFADHLQQRTHYQTDWHRYNLKRKVAQLRPVSEIEFATLQTRHQQSSAAQDTPAPQHLFCPPCGKLFAKSNQWQNHLKSNKHLLAVKNCETVSNDPVLVQKQIRSRAEDDGGDDDDEWEDEDEDQESEGNEEPDERAVRTCLFCDEVSPDLTKSLEHMSLAHSFFLPDAEFVTDVYGLVAYLGEKVRIGRICLWCNERGKSFATQQSVQKHMLDKGHCKMRLDPGHDMVEFSDFYDYSSSYPDAGDDDDVRDNSVEVNADLELVLPSGATVGHRSLKVYYKQNLPEKEEQKSVSRKTQSVNGRQLMSQYQELGYRRATALTLAAKARDLQFIQKRMMRLGIRNNKLQRHFRSQIDF